MLTKQMIEEKLSGDSLDSQSDTNKMTLNRQSSKTSEQFKPPSPPIRELADDAEESGPRPWNPARAKLEKLPAVGDISKGTSFCWPTEEDMRSLNFERKMRLNKVNLKHEKCL